MAPFLYHQQCNSMETYVKVSSRTSQQRTFAEANNYKTKMENLSPPPMTTGDPPPPGSFCVEYKASIDRAGHFLQPYGRKETGSSYFTQLHFLTTGFLLWQLPIHSPSDRMWEYLAATGHAFLFSTLFEKRLGLFSLEK